MALRNPDESELMHHQMYYETPPMPFWDRIRKESMCVGVSNYTDGRPKAYINFDLESSKTFMDWRITPGNYRQSDDDPSGPLDTWYVPIEIHYFTRDDEVEGRALVNDVTLAIEELDIFKCHPAHNERQSVTRSMGARREFHEFKGTETHKESDVILERMYHNSPEHMEKPLLLVWLNKQLLKEMISYAGHLYAASIHNTMQEGMNEMNWWHMFTEATITRPSIFFDPCQRDANWRHWQGQQLFRQLAMVIATERKSHGYGAKKVWRTTWILTQKQVKRARNVAFMTPLGRKPNADEQHRLDRFYGDYRASIMPKVMDRLYDRGVDPHTPYAELTVDVLEDVVDQNTEPQEPRGLEPILESSDDNLHGFPELAPTNGQFQHMTPTDGQYQYARDEFELQFD